MSIDSRSAVKNSHLQSKPRRATISALREPSRQTPSPRRRVTVSETSQIFYVADLSEGPQKADLWFTKEEMKLFKADVSKYVRVVQLRIARGHAPTASDILGLEKFLTPRLVDEYRRRRERRFDDIVDELCWQQEQLSWASQREREVTPAHLDFFADRLASTAAGRSRWARDQARAVALFLHHDQEIEREARRRPEGRIFVFGGGAPRPVRRGREPIPRVEVAGNQPIITPTGPLSQGFPDKRKEILI